MRGTPEAYKNLLIKEEDTLYFISEKNSLTGQLYLGSKLISDDDANELKVSSLGDLADVVLPADLHTLIEGDILTFDPSQEKWIVRNFEELITNLPSIEVKPIRVYSTELQENETLKEAVERITKGIYLKIGDLVIIKELIYDDKYQYTTFIYDSKEWKLLNENYNAENVYFDEDLTTTVEIGNISLGPNGTAVVPAAGKNLKEVFNTIFVKEKFPSKINPSISINLFNAGLYESGTEVSTEWKATFNDGSYTYGPEPTGSQVLSWSVEDNLTDLNFNTNSGNFGNIIVDELYPFQIKAVVKYSAGKLPTTNLGNLYPDQQIIEDTIYQDSDLIKGYRSFFYGMDSTNNEIDSNLIRQLNNGGNYDGQKIIEFKANELAGVKRFIVAVPEQTDREGLTSAIITSSLNANATKYYKLQENTVMVKGVNNYKAVPYKIWVYSPASIANTEIHKVTLA